LSDVFLLTKPPSNPRTELCMKMIARSDDAILFLLGDGVYNILRKAAGILPAEKIFVCVEDLQARGINANDVTIQEDFYGRMVEATMAEDHAYTF